MRATPSRNAKDSRADPRAGRAQAGLPYGQAGRDPERGPLRAVERRPQAEGPAVEVERVVTKDVLVTLGGRQILAAEISGGRQAWPCPSRQSQSTRSPVVRRVLPNAAIHGLAQQVGVPGMTSVFLHLVKQQSP